MVELCPVPFLFLSEANSESLCLTCINTINAALRVQLSELKQTVVGLTKHGANCVGLSCPQRKVNYT